MTLAKTFIFFGSELLKIASIKVDPDLGKPIIYIGKLLSVKDIFLLFENFTLS